MAALFFSLFLPGTGPFSMVPPFTTAASAETVHADKDQDHDNPKPVALQKFSHLSASSLH
jgi:hypothetical protein